MKFFVPKWNRFWSGFYILILIESRAFGLPVLVSHFGRVPLRGRATLRSACASVPLGPPAAPAVYGPFFFGIRALRVPHAAGKPRLPSLKMSKSGLKTFKQIRVLISRCLAWCQVEGSIRPRNLPKRGSHG